MNELPWLTLAKSMLGTHERLPNGKDNPVVLDMLARMGSFSKEKKAWWHNTQEPWCGLFVGYIMGMHGRFVVPEWYRAKAWNDSRYLTPLSKPAQGAIAVKTRKGGGHVCIVDHKLPNRMLGCIGGNQSDSVSVAYYRPDQFDAFLWPSVWDGEKCVKSNPLPARYDIPMRNAPMGKYGVKES